MTTYYEAFKVEAAKTVKPLADAVAKLEKQVAGIADRIRYEGENVGRSEAVLAAHKQSAGAKLTAGTSTYREWQTRLGRLSGDVAAARAALEILKGEILPNVEREFATVKAALQAALIHLVEAHLPEVEQKMAELIAVVLAARDSFMVACDSLFGEYADGVGFSGAQRLYPDPTHLRPDPIRPSLQIGTSLEESTVDPTTGPRRRGAYLTPAPQSAPPVIPVEKTALSPTPTPPDGPGAARTAPVELAEGETSAKEGPFDAPQAAPEALQTTRTASLEQSIEGVTAAPESAPCPVAEALDALDLEALDAEAPPEAGEKNL